MYACIPNYNLRVIFITTTQQPQIFSITYIRYDMTFLFLRKVEVELRDSSASVSIIGEPITDCYVYRLRTMRSLSTNYVLKFQDFFLLNAKQKEACYC